MFNRVQQLLSKQRQLHRAERLIYIAQALARAARGRTTVKGRPQQQTARLHAVKKIGKKG